MTEFDRMYGQIDEWHSRPPRLYADVEERMHAACASRPDWCEWEQKAYGYTVIAEEMDIKVYSACPFSFEFMSYAHRGDMEYSGLSSWHKRLPAGKALLENWIRDTEPFASSLTATFYRPVDDAHHTLDYEGILKKGLSGFLDDIAKREERADKRRRIFLESMKTGIRALIRLCGRFRDEALRLSETSCGDDKIRMLSLAKAIGHAPEHPAATFHEALNAIAFMYFAVPSLDANNISVFGHIDRLLYPYLQCDLQSGVIAADEVYDLLWRFLAIQDARYGRKQRSGTNSTVMLGGCDAAGTPVYNEISRMVLKAVVEFSLIDPKINIRIGRDSDRRFLYEIAEAQSKQVNNIAVFNDDVIIPANVAAGKAICDARLYVGGGCQENVIGHCEINNRATVYMNNCAPLMAGFFPEPYRGFIGRAGYILCTYYGCDTFDAFYDAVMHNTKLFILSLVELKNRYEKNPLPWCASPLHSAFLGDCIEKAEDMFLGGARYSYDSVSQCGIATVIDSLLAIKALVYDEKAITLAELAEAMRDNYEGHEILRSRLAGRMPKFGHETAEARELSKSVFTDLAAAATGMPNARGGYYEASLFSFRTNVHFGRSFGATPDGRLRGAQLSQGMSPSVSVSATVPQIFNALEGIDMTAYPVVAVLDMKLPPTPPEALAAVYARFAEIGGSVLQLNIVKQSDLEEALVSPEKYPDLVVRVSGYSARFLDLTQSEREEIVARAVNT